MTVHLVRFAGDDKPARKKKRMTPPWASTLFRQGLDTLEIAQRLDQSEATVLRAVTVERSKRMGLGNPYRVQE